MYFLFWGLFEIVKIYLLFVGFFVKNFKRSVEVIENVLCLFIKVDVLYLIKLFFDLG